jgi:3-oxoacyl-(acyl-carrier-protein) synthase/NAD(P)-dependent dehydrogenase (short-subunit alcohol dehydrogenase family)/acyl carrier protein
MSAAMNSRTREDLDVAVIGLSGRFPGADDHQAFWRNLVMGVDGVSRFTEEALLAAGHDARKIRNQDFVPVNGMLDGADCFDAEFFGYSRAEAAVMDPQIRLMLECVWHALESAGVDPDRRGRNIGLFLGARSTVQWTMQAMLSEQVENVGGFLASQLSNKDAMSTLISWKLGLEGPSFTLQTACSTSLVSIHQAVQSLLSGECDFAVAGGVSLLLPQQNGHVYQAGMLFSRDGRTRAFDADATGSVFGSGLGAVVLRRAGDAIADGDPIWAILKGSAINNDGSRKVGYTAPSVKGQAEVIRAALELAEAKAADLDYIECHGTATALGDSIEFMALREVFQADRHTRTNQCALGAVKGNIGHLDSAAGVASFIKMVLAIRHGVIPPTLHFERPNSQLDFENSPFYINTQAEPWLAQPGKLRLGGVSSFGIGGTNVHVVLQQYLPAEAGTGANEVSADEPWLFPFSAKTPAALRRQLETMAQWLLAQDGLDLRALSHTLAKRHSFACRAVLVAADRFSLMQEIKRYLDLEEAIDALSWLQPALSGERLQAACSWLSGKKRDLAASLLPAGASMSLLEVPGYAFEREAHPTSFIPDRAWGQIAGIVAGTQTGAASRNAPALLTPFWRPTRIPAALQSAGVRPVLLDAALTALSEGMNGLHIETHQLNLHCAKQLRATLAPVLAGARTDQTLVLALAFPGDAFAMTEDSLATLSALGRALAEVDFSGFAGTHCYLSTIQPQLSSQLDAASAVFTTAALKSLALVAPQEVPGLRCAFLDMQSGSRASLKGLAALLHAPQPGPLRLNDDGLFVEDFRIPDARENRVIDAARFAGKTFLITGAGGRMARSMALTLAQRFQARLGLISRQSADSPAMQTLQQELLAAGAAAVAVFPYALGSAAEGVASFRAIRQQLGEVFAVIHAAGVTDGDSFSPLTKLEARHYLEQLAPKAMAAQVLAEVFAQVEYCFATSSMSAFFGGIAHAPYAAANLFLDGWGALQNRQMAAPRWVVVNWETVHFETSGEREANAWGANEAALTGAEFPALFEQSLREHDGEDQKIFSAGRFVDRLFAWGGRVAAQKGGTPATAMATPRRARPATLRSAYLAPANNLQQQIADVWAAILGVHEIGVDDRFTELGGDSLKTIVMAERIYKKLGKRLSIQDFFALPTIREVERQCLLEHAAGHAALPELDPAASIPASPGQEQLYMHQTAFMDGSYNMPLAFHCPGSFGVQQIAASIEQIADRHLVLKCRFERRGADLLMLPQTDAQIGLTVIPANADAASALARLEQFAAMPFDLNRSLPIRAMVIEAAVASESHRVLIVIHHIVGDAVSLGILARDFRQLMAGATLPPLEYSFAAYRRQQQHNETNEQARKDKAYWLANLLPLPAGLSLPVEPGADMAIAADSHRGATQVRSLPAATSERVRELCRTLGVTPFVFFLGAVGVLLAKVGNAESLLLGVPVTGRNKPEVLSVVGYLVNMLAWKIEPDPGLRLSDYLLDLQARWQESQPYQSYPINHLLGDLKGEGYCRNRKGKHPLFDVVFGYLPHSLNGADDTAAEAGFSLLELPTHTAKFDLAIDVAETRDTFDCLIQYREHLFGTATVIALFDHFFRLLEEMLNDPETAVALLLPQLRPAERAAAPSAVTEQDVDLEFDF